MQVERRKPPKKVKREVRDSLEEGRQVSPNAARLQEGDESTWLPRVMEIVRQRV